ncbi:MAG: hypothetical protein ACP5NW_03775 [Candidatus Woesearchaeota archaeon]
MSTRQRARYHDNTESDLKQEYLKIEYMANEEEAFKSNEVKREIAGILFRHNIRQIIAIDKDPYFEYFRKEREIQKINVQFQDAQRKSFYLKKSWEGKYLEGCGMALHNIFFDEGFNFIMSEKKNSPIIAVEEMPGITFWDAKDQDINNEIVKRYGTALEFAAMIGLGDRNSSNMIITPNNNVVNIDFGKIFQNRYNHPIISQVYIAQRFKQQLKYGRIEGRKMLKEKLEDNRENIESIIQQTAEIKGFQNTKYASIIKQEYIDNPYNTFMNNLEKME